LFCQLRCNDRCGGSKSCCWKWQWGIAKWW